MPIYEYVCLECKNKFEVKATLEEKEKGLNPECPRCGSKKTSRFFGNFMFISGSQGGSCGPGCSCR